MTYGSLEFRNFASNRRLNFSSSGIKVLSLFLNVNEMVQEVLERTTHEYCRVAKSRLSPIATVICVAGISFRGASINFFDRICRGLSELGKIRHPSNHVGGLNSWRDSETHHDPGGGPYHALSDMIMMLNFHILSVKIEIRIVQ